MDGNMFAGLDALMRLCFTALTISVPLAIWKVIDIAIWIWNHVEVSL